ncbi:RNA-guided endonuclease InsQ/TnpB family protein [Rhodococcus sp. NPDC060090]|uniref:RNA-guided endonuclease InsQ/TnpB family protein n=1 Tax=Rhodococcus sp. NPDC060090 TaxID=3347056 RepID=UPI003646855B
MAKKAVKRAFKYRFYPTPEQAAELNRTFGCVRLVWNKALDERQRRYTTEQKSTTYVQASAALTQWKKTDDLAFLREVSSVPLQQALRHQQTAFSNFFAKRAKYPRFKSRKKSRASAEYTRSGFSWRDGQLTLAKMSKPLDVHWSRGLPGEPSMVTVSRDSADRWFVSILTEDTITTLPQVAATVGIDVGLTTLATLSTGEKITNPRHERRDRLKLAKAQRELSRKEKGSNNREKARRKVARVYARIADRRTDHLHKLSTRLIRENQAIAIEDLSVRNMVANHSLARAISDASWRQLRTMLEYKADWYGRDLLVVDRWYPSTRVCSECGALHDRLPLNIREWTCRCGTVHDRDANAARNILAAGLAER